MNKKPTRIYFRPHKLKRGHKLTEFIKNVSIGLRIICHLGGEKTRYSEVGVRMGKLL